MFIGVADTQIPGWGDRGHPDPPDFAIIEEQFRENHKYEVAGAIEKILEAKGIIEEIHKDARFVDDSLATEAEGVVTFLTDAIDYLAEYPKLPPKDAA